MIIDLHNHAELSKHTDLVIDDYILKAKEFNVSAAITEHNRLYNKEGKVDEVLIFSGIEVLNDYGDFLVFGTPEKCIDIRQDIFKLIDYVHSHKGIIIAAHPFSGYGICKVLNENMAGKIIERLDGIEVYNGRTSKEEWNRALNLAAAYKKTCIGGSDAHEKRDLFKVGTLFVDNIENIYDLVKAVKNGRCKPIVIRE